MRKIKKKLKKYFIPHSENDYHPHIFRNASILGIVIICIFFLGIVLGNNVFFNKTVLGATIAADVLVDLANYNRLENNISPLIRNGKLSLAASLKNQDMFSANYFAHNSPDGVTPWYFINKAGYNFVYAGENLAVNFLDNDQVEKAWMASTLHRANLLNSKFKDIGISVREGVYKNNKSIFIVEMFGSESSFPKPNNQSSQSQIKVVTEDKNFITVKSLATNLEKSDAENKAQVAGVEMYSTWWQRFMFNSSFYLQIFYFVLFLVITAAFLFRIFIEYKKQHTKHLIISFLLLVFLLTMIYINSSFLFI